MMMMMIRFELPELPKFKNNPPKERHLGLVSLITHLINSPQVLCNCIYEPNYLSLKAQGNKIGLVITVNDVCQSKGMVLKCTTSRLYAAA